MKRILILTMFLLLLTLTACTFEKQPNYEFTNQSFTLDTYYSDLQKYVYTIKDKTLYIFKDINKEPETINLNDYLSTGENTREIVPNLSNIESMYDVSYYYTKYNSLMLYSLSLQVEERSTVVYSIESMSSIKGLLICNLIEKKCARQDFPEKISKKTPSKVFLVNKNINNNSLIITTIPLNETNAYIYYVDEKLNITNIYESTNYISILDYDHLNGKFYYIKEEPILAEGEVNDDLVKTILYDFSNYNSKLEDRGIKKTIEEKPADYASSSPFNDHQYITLERDINLGDVLNISNSTGEIIETLDLRPYFFDTYLNENFILLNKSENNYIYDVNTKQYYDLKTEGYHIGLPRVIGNKMFYSNHPIQEGHLSYYFDLETKTVNEFSPLSIVNNGRYFTNQVQLFKCTKTLYSTCEREEVSLYHETLGLIENVPFADHYFIGDNQLFYKNNNKVMLFNYNTKDIIEVSDVSTRFDVLKYNKDTYLLNIDHTLYQFKDHALTELSYINSLK